MHVERCPWADWDARPDPVLAAYHDDEWGYPVEGDRELFEMLALDGFQAGLSWSIILRKRPAFRAAFRGFDPAVVARFDATDRERLLADAGIVRNRLKIDATIRNAGAFLTIVDAFGSFRRYLGEIVPAAARPLPPGTTIADVPARTPASDALSRDLQRRGLRFVGSTIVYAFMQSAGIVDDHVPGCFRYRG